MLDRTGKAGRKRERTRDRCKYFARVGGEKMKNMREEVKGEKEKRDHCIQTA